MKISIKKPIAVLSAILVFAVTLSLSLNVFARTVPPDETHGPLNMRLSSEGIISWDDIPDTTGYEIAAFFDGRLAFTDNTLNEPSFGFVDTLDNLKKDSGRYEVQVTPIGVSNPGDHQDFYYVSPFEKLQTPTNIVWDGNTISWNAVNNATSYTLAKYDASGNLILPYINVDSTSYTFLPNPDDGSFVKIKATASEYRDSDFAESPLKGGVERSIATQAKEGVLHMYLNSEGILSWDGVTGATTFEVRASYNGMIVAEDEVSDTSYELIHFLDESRVDSGEIIVHIRPIGIEGYEDEQTFSYVSCWSKLEAPASPRWDDEVAHWNVVEGADTYLLTLYDADGHTVIADYPVVDSNTYDFSMYYPDEGWFFTVRASNIIPGQIKRDSAINESPKKAPIPIETVSIIVAEPIVNERPDLHPRVEDSSNYHIDYADPLNAPNWFLYAGGSYPSLNPDDVFEYDKTYGFTVHIVADEGYALTDGTTYTVNGREASKIGGELPSWAFVKLDFTTPSEPIPITYYTASFDSHDGSEVAPQVIAEGGTVNRPEDPVWDGHVFLGWYTSSEYTEEYDFSSSINQNLTIHAKWAIAIPSASATVTTPMGTKYPDFSPVAGGDTYTVTVNDWYLYEEPYDSLSTGSHFQDGKEYALRLAFEPNEGYAFTNDATFTINGLSTDCYGRINDREIRFTAGTPIYIHSASATVTTPIYRAHPDFNPTTDESGYSVETESWRLFDSSLDYPEINPESTFEGGKTYQLGYYLIADDTHAFANDATFTLNGQPAYSVGGDGSTYIFIRYWFDIPVYNITTSVYDLTSEHSATGGQTELYADKSGWSGYSYDEHIGNANSTTYAYVGATPDADYEFIEWRLGGSNGEVFSTDQYVWFKPENDMDLVAIFRRLPTMVSYTTHVQSYGWQDYVSNGTMAGTSGEAKRLEAIKIKLEHAEYTGDIEYRTHIQTYGWEENFKKNNEMSGTSGEAKRLEAIEIRLTGEMAEHYDIYYRVHAQTFGWLGWARNGERAGTASFAKRLEAIEIKLVEKGSEIPGYGDIEAFKDKKIVYTTHVQTYGWQNYTYDGNMAGTSGEAKRLEAIKIKLNNPKYEGDVEYRTHIQTYGWEENFKKNNEMSGTSGEAKRLEAIEIRLTGEMAEHYDIYYRVHAQTFGWLAYAKNGEPAGTAGFAKRLEGIEILLMPKDEIPPVPANQNNDQAYIENNN